MPPLTTKLSDAIGRAEKAGACPRDIDTLRDIDTGQTLADLLDHPRAAEWACWYAFRVIKGRWPEAEDVIRKDDRWACFYARFVIEGRWPEAEDVIRKNAESSYWYARDLLRGAWPEMEDA